MEARVGAPPARHVVGRDRPLLRPPTWTRQAWLILRKDLAIELRTGEVLATSGFFAVLVVVIASMAFYGGPETKRLVAAGVVWISIAFSAVLALGRSWQRERDERALLGILVAPVSRSALFAGKWIGLAAFLLVVEAMVVPLTALLFSIDLMKHGVGVVLISLAAIPGIAASGTLFGAMTVRTKARDLVLAVVLFPLLSPTLLAAVVATRELFDGASLGELTDYLLLMGVFDVALCAGGLAMFGPLIED